MISFRQRLQCLPILFGGIAAGLVLTMITRISSGAELAMSMLVGAPQIREEFIEVHGFWLPAHVRSVSSSLLLGPSELDIRFTNYQVGGDAAPVM